MNDAGRIGFVTRGEYNNTETYDFLDVVYYGNSSYAAKKLTVGNTPADNNEYWQALAKVPVSAVLGVKGNAESAYRTGNINLTAANVGAVNKGGDTIPGRLKFINSADLRFIAPDVTTGDHARGMVFMDKSDTEIWGGIGVLGRAGEPQYIYIGAGTPYPWDSSQGLYISNANILWKGAKLVTENSGTAKEAVKATQDSNGKVITDTYAKKSIYDDTTVSQGRKSGTTVGVRSFAFGYNTTASGTNSHAEGGNTTASGTNSHAEGYITTASGDYSHAGGYFTISSGKSSHAMGYYAHASNFASCAIGKGNRIMNEGGELTNQVGDVFVIGNGNNATSETSNAFRVTYQGQVYGKGAFNTSGADYAEFIKPWADGNPDQEDRVGYFVTVKDGLLHKANEEDYIVGITSGNPSIVGNADEDYYWRYERDEFNRIVLEDVPETVQKTDEEGKLVFDEETHQPVMIETGKIIPKARMKLSKDYDPALQQNYIERKDRKEWDYVGMLGVLPVRDDGSCQPGQFCKCGKDGIATLVKARGFDTYMVLERISENIVSVILK